MFSREILGRFGADEFLKKLGPTAKNVVLCCFEQSPAACHRSMVAKYLEEEWEGVKVEHL